MGDSLLKLNSLLNLLSETLEIKETTDIKCIKMNRETMDSLQIIRPSNGEIGYTFEIRGIPIEIDEHLKDCKFIFEFKSDKDKIGDKVDDVLKKLRIKEGDKLSMKRMLENNFRYYEKIKRFDLCEKCKDELITINCINEFIYNLIADIEEIKNMLDELK